MKALFFPCLRPLNLVDDTGVNPCEKMLATQTQMMLSCDVTIKVLLKHRLDTIMISSATSHSDV